MDVHSLLFVFALWTLFPGYLALKCSLEKRCRTLRTHGLKTSDCFDMNWKEFPKCLPSDVEVVELSYNRIRKVTNSDLQRYPYLTHLYLTDNLLVNLDDETFKDVSRLETLDLSVNALGKVPPTIFQLPSLKSLYLSQNQNINIAESLEEAKPIQKSSLTKLDMSYITDDGETTDFPDFADLPYLAFLNISGDQFNYLSTRHFAGLCNLQILANSNATAYFENDCDCWKINHWLKERKIKFNAFQCSRSERECIDQEIDAEDLEIYQKCRAKYEEIKRSLLWKKIGIGIGAAFALVLFIAAIVFYRKWKKNKAVIRRERRIMNSLHEDQLLANQTKV